MADTKRHFLVLVFCLLLICGHVTSAKVKGRGRISDDSGPLEAVVKGLSQKVEQLIARNAAQDADIASLENNLAEAEEAIAFTATFQAADHHEYGPGQILKFDKVVYNAGSGYSTQTGLFTAPSDGTYLFYTHLTHSNMETTSSSLEVDLYAGSQSLVRVSACCQDLDSGSNMATVHLKQGDTVRAQVHKGSALWGGGHSSFSGLRLSTK